MRSADDRIHVVRITTDGLGDDTSVAVAEGLAAVVDPQRDVERVLEVLEREGATLQWILETHVHNDYVSGAAALARATGATIVGPADAGYGFEVRGVRDGDVLALGGATLRALATPGHTPEHTSYLLERADGIAFAVFSGGSLIVGSAGRTDLLGAALVPELTRKQHASLRRLASLPDEVRLYPTHGAGSFCASAPSSSTRDSTIGDERRSNALLAIDDADAFAQRALEGLPTYPTYYANMAPLNRAGVDEPLEPPMVTPLGVDAFADAVADGAVVVDARDGASFASAHVPGSLSVPIDESFATYVGWLVPFGAELALIVPDEETLRECVTQLFRIGYDRIGGVLAGGVDAWADAGRALASYATVDARSLADEVRRGVAGDVLDVRQTSEWDAGHLDGSRHVFVGDVRREVGHLDRERTHTVVCASGFRASIAASVLDAAGVPVRVLARGGAPNVLARLER